MAPLNCGIPQCGQCSANGGHTYGFQGQIGGSYFANFPAEPGSHDVEITRPDGTTFIAKNVEITVEGLDGAKLAKEEAQQAMRDIMYPKGPMSMSVDFQSEEDAIDLLDWEEVAQRVQDDATIYISGPMRGIPEHNYPKFNAVAQQLRQRGYEVVNPAEHFSGDTGLANEVYLRADVGLMAERCNAIFLLPGWQNSAGARLEYHVATALGFEVMNEEEEYDETDVTEPVEYEASRIVRNGLRQQNYGHPNQDFQRTAGMWTAFLAHKLKPGEVITMEEMALMMGQLKMSRLASTPGHHDSIVDLIGYAICYDRLGETE